MSDAAWQVRISPQALSALDRLPHHAREILRDLLDIASRDPWSFPAFNRQDPEGEDVRSASVGQLTAVYWINRSAGRLYAIDIIWLG
ncbi:type II toxin-antitoxin system RelE/ParE family toxin [Streptomyces sp. NPDC059008]|uniref:type II toxin-antitoxin system RelE family toxin n=1 Tax=Streptomyces sp. NPDC059008 TaxID=3346693 RepID=UPI0036C3ECD4